MNRRKQIFIFFLVLFHSSLLHAGSVNIDLNRNDTYVIRGFDADYLHNGMKNNTLIQNLEKQLQEEKDKKNGKNIYKLPATDTGRKLAPLSHFHFEGLPKAGFYKFGFFKSMHFTYITPFKITEAEYNALVNPSFFITSLGTGWEIYLNGQKITSQIDSNESPEAKPRTYNTRYIHSAVDKNILKKGDNYLVVHIFSDPLSDFSGYAMANEQILGNYEDLLKLRDKTLDLVFIFSYLIVGLYHILLYLRRPKEKYNLDFGLFGIGLFIYLLMRANVVHEAFIHATFFLYLVELVVLYLIVISFLFFVDRYLTGRLSRFSKVYFIWALLLSTATIIILTITGSLRISNNILRTWHFSMIFVLFYILYATFSRLIFEFKGYISQYKKEFGRRKIFKSLANTFALTGAGNLIIGVVVLMITVAYDILEAAIFHTGITLTQFGFFVFVMGIAVSLANRFLNVYKQVEDLNQNLEKKVEERTNELAETLEHVNSLKVQQDGDYFLTSLLIDPLNSNYAHNDKIKVDFFVEEKKKFRFRRWEKEIGGDICFAHSLDLRGKPYTLFLNADAMGKSMQGAGGILVLGAVLKSVTERTLLSAVEKNLFPEKWLRNIFVELQKVFESFDGSMLISCVFGLVDEENGFIYMINAEHPWTVLYRDKTAGFIEDEMTFHKLGTQGVKKKIWIRTFELQYNDILIIGSDGRDDLLLGMGQENQRIINEDEFAFLRHVENADGDILRVVEEIKKAGDITDDLSLLRLESRIQPVPVDENEHRILRLVQEAFIEKRYERAIHLIESSLSIPRLPEIWMILIRSLIKLKKYPEAQMYSCRFIDMHPGYNEFIYYAALSSFYSRKMNLAADIGERLRLRQPGNIKNLILLAEIYRAMKNPSRAEKMLQEVLNVEPDNKKAREIQEKITVNATE